MKEIAPFRQIIDGPERPAPMWLRTVSLAQVDHRLPPFTWWHVTGIEAGTAGYGDNEVLRVVFTRIDRHFAFELDKETMETTPADFRGFVVEGVRLLLVLAGLIPDTGPDWRGQDPTSPSSSGRSGPASGGSMHDRLVRLRPRRPRVALSALRQAAHAHRGEGRRVVSPEGSREPGVPGLGGENAGRTAAATGEAAMTCLTCGLLTSSHPEDHLPIGAWCSGCGKAMTPAECMDAVLTSNDLILCAICTTPDLRVIDGGLR